MRVDGKNWIVVRADGERFFVEKEPLEGILEWAKGQFVTVLEYDFGRVIYEKHPPVKSEPAPAPRATSPVSLS